MQSVTSTYNKEHVPTIKINILNLVEFVANNIPFRFETYTHTHTSIYDDILMQCKQYEIYETRFHLKCNVPVLRLHIPKLFRQNLTQSVFSACSRFIVTV